MSGLEEPTWFTDGLGLNADRPQAIADRLVDKAFDGFNWQHHNNAYARASMAQCLYLKQIAQTLDEIRNLLTGRECP